MNHPDRRPFSFLIYISITPNVRPNGSPKFREWREGERDIEREGGGEKVFDILLKRQDLSVFIRNSKSDKVSN